MVRGKERGGDMGGEAKGKGALEKGKGGQGSGFKFTPSRAGSRAQGFSAQLCIYNFYVE